MIGPWIRPGVLRRKRGLFLFKKIVSMGNPLHISKKGFYRGAAEVIDLGAALDREEGVAHSGANSCNAGTRLEVNSGACFFVFSELSGEL
jgi:hypothetical protein